MKAREQKLLLNAIQKFIHSNREMMNNVIDVELGYKRVGKGLKDDLCIRFIVTKKLKKSEIQKTEGITFIPESIIGFATDVIDYGEYKPQSDYQQCFNPLIGSAEIANNDLVHNQGTLACILQNDMLEKYGISCHHVLFGKFENGIGGAIIQPNIYAKENIIGFASLHNCLHNKEIDIVAFPIKNRDTSNSIFPFNNKDLNIARVPVVGNHVKKSGITTRVTYGIVESISINNWKLTVSKNLNKMTQEASLTDFGDSGALWVLDSNNSGVLQGIGVHTAISDTYENVSISTSLKYICNLFKLKP